MDASTLIRYCENCFNLYDGKR